MFNNPDIAFDIDFEHKIIEIKNIALNSVEYSFKVHNVQLLMTIQSLFRKKMC